MIQQPEPLSPEERGHLREALARVMGPLRGTIQPAPYSEDLLINPATLIELIAENDSLAARVSSLEARWRTFQSESAQLNALQALRAKAQEVRRAWDDPRHDFGHLPNGACDKIEWTKETGHYETALPCSCGHDALRAAIDALVPPVPAAPPENEKEARS